MNNDNVERPSHYQIKEGCEVIDVREWWLSRTDDEFVGLVGGVTTISHLDRALEYLLRAPGKNGMEDVRKAYQYLHRALHGEWPGNDERVDEIVRERELLRAKLEALQ